MVPLLVVFGITYLLIATEKVDKTIAAILGAGAAICGHFVGYEEALRHIDLNVIFLLMGMMIVVNVFSRTGLFEWLAVVIAQKARGSGVAVMAVFLLATAFFSAFLDNVTTVILIAPVTILIAQVLEIPAVPLLVLEAVFSNIGGTATLVGDPPNILIGSRGGLSFNAFLVHLGPAVLLILLTSLVAVVVFFGRTMRARKAAIERIMKANASLAITDRASLRTGLVVFGGILAGFFLGRFLDVEPGIVALTGGILMAGLCRADLRHLLEKVEWSTLLFFIGLFMLVGALEENGVFALLGRWIVGVTRGNLPATAIVILWTSAIASAIVDNIPLVMAMIPLIKSIIPGAAVAMGLAGDPGLVQARVAQPLFWALALGACLGGNGTLVGASANVVIAQIARRNKYPLSFWTFTRFGLPFMVLSLVISTAYLYVRYFLWP